MAMLNQKSGKWTRHFQVETVESNESESSESIESFL